MRRVLALFAVCFFLLSNNQVFAGEVDDFCQVLLACQPIMTQSECVASFEGESIPRGFSACLSGFSCEQINSGEAMASCEELVLTMGSVGTGPTGGDDQAFEAACKHGLACAGEEMDLAECVSFTKQQLGTDENGQAWARCYAASSCESIAAGQPDACTAMVQQNAAQQSQHHETMMNIIGNMGGGKTTVTDENGNTLYTY